MNKISKPVNKISIPARIYFTPEQCVDYFRNPKSIRAIGRVDGGKIGWHADLKPFRLSGNLLSGNLPIDPSGVLSAVSGVASNFQLYEIDKKIQKLSKFSYFTSVMTSLNTVATIASGVFLNKKMNTIQKKVDAVQEDLRVIREDLQRNVELMNDINDKLEKLDFHASENLFREFETVSQLLSSAIDFYASDIGELRNYNDHEESLMKAYTLINSIKRYIMSRNIPLDIGLEMLLELLVNFSLATVLYLKNYAKYNSSRKVPTNFYRWADGINNIFDEEMLDRIYDYCIFNISLNEGEAIYSIKKIEFDVVRRIENVFKHLASEPMNIIVDKEFGGI